MPSWNIHSAQVERLLAKHEPASLGISDVNAFLFGNFVPDIYVGYMVAGVSHTLSYHETHFVDPGAVPQPRYWEFWERFAAPCADEHGHISEIALGAWAHLAADYVYNRRFNELIQRLGVARGERTRVRKQADFLAYGRTLTLSMVPEPTEALLAQAQGFCQYPIELEDARATCAIMKQIVRDNAEKHIEGKPRYKLLDDAYISQVTHEVDQLLLSALLAYAEGKPDWGAEQKLAFE